MTDKEYKAQKKRVQAYRNKWEQTLGLGWYRLHHTWHRERKDDTPNTAATTTMLWQYHEYDFDWYLPALADLTDEELEECIVHEFCHALTAPLMHEDTEAGVQIYEHVITTIQKAICWAREADK